MAAFFSANQSFLKAFIALIIHTSLLIGWIKAVSLKMSLLSWTCKQATKMLCYSLANFC